jgi:hypothetical protein
MRVASFEIMPHASPRPAFRVSQKHAAAEGQRACKHVKAPTMQFVVRKKKRSIT